MTQPSTGTVHKSSEFPTVSGAVRACSCLNVTVRFRADAQQELQNSEEGVLRKIKIQEKDIIILHLNLTAREPVTLVRNDLSHAEGEDTGIEHRVVNAIGLRCTLCASIVYCVEKVASSGPVRSVGFLTDPDSHTKATASTDKVSSLSPSRDKERQPSALPAASNSVLRPADGWVWLLPGCSQDRTTIERSKRSDRYSETFQVLINPAAIDQRVREADSSPARNTFARFTSSKTTGIGKAKGPASPALNRAPSYGSMSASQYQLPPVPTSLLRDVTPPHSPATRSPPATPLLSATLPHGSAFQNLQHQKQLLNPLVLQLETVAIEKIREYRAQADTDILELVRKKRIAMDTLEREAKEQAEAIIALANCAPISSAAAPVRFSVSPLRDHDVESPKGRPRNTKQDSLSPTNIPSIPGAENVSSSESYEDESLPPSAFQRRRPSVLPHKDSISSTTINASGTNSPAMGTNGSSSSQYNASSGGNAISTSLSALSASFAMRGRELPQMEAWANKRRMRERYPEGDHSALNSADPSGDESELTEEDEEVQREEDARGRGRDRGRGNGNGGNGRGGEGNESNITIRGSEPSSKPTPIGQRASTAHAAPSPSVAPFRRSGGTSEREQEEQRQRDVTPSGRGRTATRAESENAAPPTTLALSSSKVAPSVLVHRDATSDHDSETQSGGVASGDLSGNVREGAAHAEASRTLREADASLAASTSGSITSGSSLGALGGALRLSSSTGVAKKSKKKRVAFADHAVKVGGADVAQDSDSNDDDDEPQPARKTLLDERDTAVFDIDEEVHEASDEDDANKVSDMTDEMNALVLDPQSLGLETSSDDDGTDDDGIPASNFATSVAEVGSLSALAASQSLQHNHGRRSESGSALNELDPNFDPASLRLDGRIARVPTKSGQDVLPERYTQVDTSFHAEERSMPGSMSISKIRAPYASGDADAMLSGLMAPQAPSHRDLWSRSGDKARKQNKYRLDEEDDEKWAAWKLRVIKSPERSTAEGASQIAHSLPHDARGLAVPSPRTRAAMALPFGFAEQGPGFAPQRPTAGAFERSGFEREPKTSLPYGEKMLVPSLLQAIRRDRAGREGVAGKPRLSPIPSSDTSGTPQDVSAPGRSAAGGPKLSPQGALPSSVTQRGFRAFGEASEGLRKVPLVPPSNLPSARPDSATLAALKSLPRKRSQPYLPPPQPTSSDLVLQPDPSNAPVPLELFVVPKAADFIEREEEPNGSGAEQGEAAGRVGDSERETLRREVEWMHRVGQLKVKKRTGWKHHRVREPESIADHMYRMAMLAMLCPATDVDIGRCVQLALVHDLAEAEVGDLTPLDGVSKEDKVRREKEAIEYHVYDLLGNSPAAKRIMALWLEYEERITKEARLVKDLDRFELCLQALEYERSDSIIDLQPFWRTSIGHISHPTQRKWAEQLALERQELWRSRGVDYTQAPPSAPAHPALKGDSA